MNKGNASLFGATLVITAAIVAGVYLLDRAQQSAASGSAEESGWTTLIPSQWRDADSSPSGNADSLSRDTTFLPSSRIGQSPHPGEGETGNRSRSWPGPSTTNLVGVNPATSTGNVSAETSPTGIENIITCQHPEYGTVYSNAASCDEVDYDSRLSRADSFQAVPDRDRYSGSDYHSPESAAANSRSYSTNKKEPKPNLRLHGKSPPSGLNVSCKFSVGKALEIERDLAASGNPSESSWRKSYCKFRCEAIQESCPVADDYFYYRYTALCPQYWQGVSCG